MTGPVDPPRFRALEIGPGGIPAEQVRPVGGGAPESRPGSTGVSGSTVVSDGLPPIWRNWASSAPLPDQQERRRFRQGVVRVVAGLLALGLVIGLGWWANASHPLGDGSRAAAAVVGDCVSSSGQRITDRVACGGAAAAFTVVGRYPNASDASACSSSPADVAVILAGPTVLCLDYVVAVGDCLFAGARASQVGKVDCASTSPGVYRVTAVIRNSVDSRKCPVGTTRSLIHRHNSQVICLGPA